MSIDLEWDKLDSSLSSALVDVLNTQLSNTQRPSFIGPVEVTSLEFGSSPPDVELVDLRDIYRDFLEDDEDENVPDRKATAGVAGDVDGYEWVPRRAARREEGLAYHHLPPHVRHGHMFASTPALHSPREVWNGGTNHLADLSPSMSSSWPGPHFRSPTPSTPFSSLLQPNFDLRDTPDESSAHKSDTDPSQIPSDQVPNPPPESSSTPTPPLPPDNPHPNLQLHLHVNWHSNLRITLTTSLLINYPSPMFMSLPIKLSVTGLLFTGELVVAYEGERKRVHICILDDLDPYGPVGDRTKRDSIGNMEQEPDEDSPITGVPPRPAKPLPVGQRLLPSIFIESEIGQADKHVLKNVTRVERFIQDVIRKTVEEELVFPNFHTLVLSDG
jgi:distribution and morphology protein 12